MPIDPDRLDRACHPYRPHPFACICGRSFLVMPFSRCGHPVPVFWDGDRTVDTCPVCHSNLYSLYHGGRAPTGRREALVSGGNGCEDSSRRPAGTGSPPPFTTPVSPPRDTSAGANRQVGADAGGGPNVIAAEPLEIRHARTL